MTDHDHDDKNGVSRRGVLGGTAVAGVAALSAGGAYLEFDEASERRGKHRGQARRPR